MTNEARRRGVEESRSEPVLLEFSTSASGNDPLDSKRADRTTAAGDRRSTRGR